MSAKQKRSRETRARIINATAQLLEQQLFDDLSIKEIVKEAKATVGSFYNLFDDKNALLPELYQLHCEQLKERVGTFLDETEEHSLTGLISGLVENIVELHRSQRGLLRALVLHAHCFPVKRTKERPNEMTELLPRLARMVAEKNTPGDASRSILPAKLGLLMVLSTVRELHLYPATSANSLKIPQRSIVKQLTTAWLSYLGSVK